MTMRRQSTAKHTGELTFNHAMVYSRDVATALHFYHELLGFKVIEQMEYSGRLVYARLGAQSGGTIALHMLDPGRTMPEGDGIRLYFETRNLKKFCERLQKSGVKFSQLPKMMPWGWKHAYLDDPDGHEVSLYWAGAKRFKPSRMKV